MLDQPIAEQPEDRARLTDPALFLRGYADRLVVLDEVQRVPDMFEVLRGLIDERRRAGKPEDQQREDEILKRTLKPPPVPMPLSNSFQATSLR